MKKLTIAALMLLGSFSVASAGPGINIGVSSQLGVFEAKAEESINGVRKDTGEAVGVFGYSSFFIEKTLGSRVRIGYDYVPETIESESFTEVRHDAHPTANGGKVSGGLVTKSQTGKVKFEDISTIYLSVHLTEGLYAKYGAMQIEVITDETLETGSKYGNATLDGQVMGLGYHKQTDSGLFFRVEGTVMEIDGHTFTSSVVDTSHTANQIKLDEFNGASAKLSIGKAF